MTSLALVPYTFSLLKLPFIALQNVAECLNPYEIYHFSRISKRTKKIAKAFSKKASQIYLISPFCALIKTKSKENWSFEPKIEHGPDSYTVLPDFFEPTRLNRGYAYFSKKPASEVLKVLEWLIDVFKNSKVYLNFDTRDLSRKDLISHFNWSKVTPSEVPFVSLECTHGTDIQFFLENYKRPSEEFNLVIRSENDERWFEDRERVELPDNLETNLFKKVKITNCKPVNMNLYNIFSSPVIFSIENNKLTNQDLNTLIKNWQSGLTNSHWRSVCISGGRQINLIHLLDGIAATYRDPRTVKRQINVDKESFWIFGGIDVQKHDGSATATVQWKKYKVKNEDSEVPNELIEEYERNQESGEVQHIVEQRDGIMAPILVFDTFCMYIW